MRKIAILLVCALLLSACGNLFAREYEYSAPYTGTGSGSGAVGGNATDISNYNMLRSALLDLINAHTEIASFRFNRYNGSVADDLAEACLEIKTSHPLGAWAVEAISYDTSRIVSYYVADLTISYKKSAEEIASILTLSGVDDLEPRLRALLEADATEAVLRIYSSQVHEGDIREMVNALCCADPVSIPLEPELSIGCYPAEGSNRIYDLRLNYGVSTNVLRRMREAVPTRLDTLRTELEADTEPKLALAAAELLAQSVSESEARTASTAYGALVQRSANSKGCALGYQTLCAALGLSCRAVSGVVAGLGAAEHWWNILTLDGENYHVDVTRLLSDPEHAFLLDDAALWGTYIWDTERYPACNGTLRYADLIEEDTEGENDAPSAQPNAPETPGTEPPAPTPEGSPAPTPTAEPTPEPTPDPGSEPSPEPAPDADDGPAPTAL